MAVVQWNSNDSNTNPTKPQLFTILPSFIILPSDSSNFIKYSPPQVDTFSKKFYVDFFLSNYV